MPPYPELKLYVGGEWRSRDGAPVINPADESIVGTVPHATKADLDDALSEYGIRHINMPATPFRVWQAIQAARHEGAS